MIRPFDLIQSYGFFRLWRGGLRHHIFPTHQGPVHYWRGGRGSAILLIHGIGGSTFQDFSAIGPRLARTHDVISVDLPGFGLSHSIPFEQSIGRQADFLDRFLDALDISKTTVWGNSMGGWIALKLAQLHPQRARRLILSASAGIRFQYPPLNLFTPEDIDGMQRLLNHLLAHPRHPPLWFLRDWLRVNLQRRPAVISMLNSMLTATDLMEEHLPVMDLPTFILWGQLDRLIPVETAHRLAALLPNARLEVFPDCGHLILHENLRGVMHLVEPWLQSEAVEDL